MSPKYYRKKVANKQLNLFNSKYYERASHIHETLSKIFPIVTNFYTSHIKYMKTIFNQFCGMPCSRSPFFFLFVWPCPCVKLIFTLHIHKLKRTSEWLCLKGDWLLAQYRINRSVLRMLYRIWSNHKLANRVLFVMHGTFFSFVCLFVIIFSILNRIWRIRADYWRIILWDLYVFYSSVF